MAWYEDESNADVVVLEAIIDRHSVSNVLLALETVCHAKADHLRSNWQDSRAGYGWTKMAHDINKLATRIKG